MQTTKPTTHDYRRRGWGHDYTFDPIDGGMKAKMSGWGYGIREGDYLIIQTKVPQGSRYQVTSIRCCADPEDMWFADVVFAPRKAAEIDA